MGQIDYACIRLADDGLFPEARETMGELFDLAVNECGIPGDDFAASFLVSGVAREFERLNPVFVGGKSALDLLEMIVRCLDAAVEVPVTAAPVPLVDYWVGWILAYCQHETGTPFSRIFQAVPYAEVAAAYYPLHEAPEEKFLEVFGPRIGAGGAGGSGGAGGAGGAGGCTRLARQRRAIGLSQAELADASGVGLRSIQMYEQRNKNINKASAETVLRLSRALHCTMEDVLEL